MAGDVYGYENLRIYFMANQITEGVSIKGANDKTVEGSLAVTEYSAGDRMTRAVVGWVGCWVGAAVAVFIPIAHFILVPGLLIAGPVLGWRRYKLERASNTLETACPACGKSVSIALDPTDRVPFTVYCPECSVGLNVSGH
jgi:hypothetical protein